MLEIVLIFKEKKVFYKQNDKEEASIQVLIDIYSVT